MSIHQLSTVHHVGSLKGPQRWYDLAGLFARAAALSIIFSSWTVFTRVLCDSHPSKRVNCNQLYNSFFASTVFARKLCPFSKLHDVRIHRSKGCFDSERFLTAQTVWKSRKALKVPGSSVPGAKLGTRFRHSSTASVNKCTFTKEGIYTKTWCKHGVIAFPRSTHTQRNYVCIYITIYKVYCQV